MADAGDLARRWFEEVWNRRNRAAIDELMHPDCVGIATVGQTDDREDWKNKQYDPFVAAFSEFHVEIAGVTARDDEAAVRWRATATHTGDQLGFRASGRKVDFRGLTWMRFRDGQIVEGWDSFDLGSVLQSLRE